MLHDLEVVSQENEQAEHRDDREACSQRGSAAVPVEDDVERQERGAAVLLAQGEERETCEGGAACGWAASWTPNRPCMAGIIDTPARRRHSASV